MESVPQLLKVKRVLHHFLMQTLSIHNCIILLSSPSLSSLKKISQPRSLTDNRETNKANLHSSPSGGSYTIQFDNYVWLVTPAITFILVSSLITSRFLPVRLRMSLQTFLPSALTMDLRLSSKLFTNFKNLLKIICFACFPMATHS